MAKLRKAVAYRKIERAYTRKSRKRKLNYVRAVPNNHIVKFDMGDPKRNYSHKMILKSKDDIQIRHNALEAGRKSANRLLEKDLGKNMYHMRLRVYPHHVLRENPMATGAGADRTSEGMSRSFGKPIGIAAQVRNKQPIVELKINKNQLKTAKVALTRFSHKMPCKCTIELSEIKD